MAGTKGRAPTALEAWIGSVTEGNPPLFEEAPPLEAVPLPVEAPLPEAWDVVPLPPEAWDPELIGNDTEHAFGFIVNEPILLHAPLTTA